MATKTLVDTDTTQTLTNKTLAAPTLSGAVCGADPTIPLGVATKQYTDAAMQSIFPVGAMLAYGGSTAPTGWLICDGAAISRSSYSALFAILGTVYGVGDGSITFNLPDKRGRSSMGAGTGSGLTARTRGQKIGSEVDTAPLPAHTHSYTYSVRASVGTFTGPGAQGWDGVSSASGTTGSTGPGGTHNTVHPVEVDTWIIKY